MLFLAEYLNTCSLVYLYEVDLPSILGITASFCFQSGHLLGIFSHTLFFAWQTWILWLKASLSKKERENGHEYILGKLTHIISALQQLCKITLYNIQWGSKLRHSRLWRGLNSGTIFSPSVVMDPWTRQNNSITYTVHITITYLEVDKNMNMIKH